MQKLRTIDYITSLIAALLWLSGGFLLFSLIGLIAIHTIPGYGKSPQGSPIYSVVGLLLYSGFVIGAWLVVRWFLPLFMRATRQGNFKRTVDKFIKFSWLSLLSLVPADIVARNNLVINYGLWTLSLAFIYLYTRYKTLD